jgi:hypothetical protein
MTRDIQDCFILRMQKNNNKIIISTFETMIFCFNILKKNYKYTYGGL